MNALHDSPASTRRSRGSNWLRRRTARAGSGRGASFLVVVATLLQVNLLCLFEPAVAEWLQYDRSAIAAGELWRLVTGHWVHWSFEHAAWDLFAATILLVLLRHWSARRQLVFLVGASLAISAALWCWTADLATYRGLSGVDAAWFTVVLIERWRSADRRQAWLPALAGALFAAKLIYEVTVGRAVFVSGTEVVVAQAHLVGAVWAVLVLALVATPWATGGAELRVGSPAG